MCTWIKKSGSPERLINKHSLPSRLSAPKSAFPEAATVQLSPDLHIICIATLKFIPFILMKAYEHFSSHVPYCSPACIILQSSLSVVISEFLVVCIFGVFIIVSTYAELCGVPLF